MKINKPAVIVGVVIVAVLVGYLFPVGERARKQRNEVSLRAIQIALKASVATQQWVYPNDLSDLVEEGNLYHVPLYESRDGSLKPFIYVGAGHDDSESCNLVILAAPETEPDGIVLIGANDATNKYLSPADAVTALEEARREQGSGRRPRTAAPPRGQ